MKVSEILYNFQFASGNICVNLLRNDTMGSINIDAGQGHPLFDGLPCASGQSLN